MKTTIKPLTPVVCLTSIFLVAGAFLVVLRIFNESLNGDIFPHRVESVLWAILYASVALGSFGVALTVVLGIREMVMIFKNRTTERYPEKTAGLDK